MTRPWLAIALALLLLPREAGANPDRKLDDFGDLNGWSATASNGGHVEIARDTGRTALGMRVDFDLQGGGFAIVRKAFPLALPANYAFEFALRGDSPPVTFEFKVLDSTGKNVWWYRQRDFQFPPEWQDVTVSKSRLRFAWGPAAGGMPNDVGSIELAVSAAHSVKGSFWLDDLRLESRQVAESNRPPRVVASTSADGHTPEQAVDGDRSTSWRSDVLAPAQTLTLDLGSRRELGGLEIDWDPEDYAVVYAVETSDDGRRWTRVYRTRRGRGGREYVYLPDTDTRWLRLELEESSRGRGYAIRDVEVKPLEFSASPNRFFEAIAQEAPPGTYPRYFSGKQSYWTVVGVDGDDTAAIFSEDGTLEPWRGSFTIAPFLRVDGRLVTWADVTTSQELADGYLPIPTVTWKNPAVVLHTTVFAAGRPGASVLYARYRVENPARRPIAVDLFLTIRPFQVLPPWQALNLVGGVTTVREITYTGQAVWVNREHTVVPLTPPDGFGAATFQEGSITDFLARDALPQRTQVLDPMGWASGALRYRLRIPARDRRDVDVAIPLHDPQIDLAAEAPPARVTARLEDTARWWTDRLSRVDVHLPPVAEDVVPTLKTTLAYILINRAGPALHPGPRTYARSWIRDGALTSAALLEMGYPDEVRDFLRWYARFQADDGRIPCCVDGTRPDSVPENDSDGEFIWAVAEYWRFTRDKAFVQEMWPAVARAAAHIEKLRAERTTEAYTRPSKEAFYGLLPESISHEGYSAHPVHSYWDDFFGLRGLGDAAALARVVGDDAEAGRLEAARDDFRTDLYASIERTRQAHEIDYVPGSAELGDFDPTSTAIALTMAGELPNLPPLPLAHTFDRYYQDVVQRTQPATAWEAYTPYELRNVGALVLLGERDRAMHVLDLILADQRPRAWREWPEILWRDPTAPRFIGDMPHTWVGAGFILSVRTMLAYERDTDQALVLGAGLPLSWVLREGGVSVHGLPTYWGQLDYTLQGEGEGTLRLHLGGDLKVPPGGIVVKPPCPEPLTAATVDGKVSAPCTADSAVVRTVPADVVLRY